MSFIESLIGVLERADALGAVAILLLVIGVFGYLWLTGTITTQKSCEKEISYHKKETEHYKEAAEEATQKLENVSEMYRHLVEIVLKRSDPGTGGPDVG